MKVRGPDGSKSVTKSKKSNSSKGLGGASFSSMLSTTAAKAEESKAAQTIAQVDNLLAVQAMEDPTEKESQGRMKQRAHNILDALDTIKLALLNGNLRMSHLENIERMINANRERINDPKLAAILDEIDLRAQVEMAKLEMAKDMAIRALQSA